MKSIWTRCTGVAASASTLLTLPGFGLPGTPPTAVVAMLFELATLGTGEAGIGGSGPARWVSLFEGEASLREAAGAVAAATTACPTPKSGEGALLMARGGSLPSSADREGGGDGQAVVRLESPLGKRVKVPGWLELSACRPNGFCGLLRASSSIATPGDVVAAAPEGMLKPSCRGASAPAGGVLARRFPALFRSPGRFGSNCVSGLKLRRGAVDTVRAVRTLAARVAAMAGASAMCGKLDWLFSSSVFR